MNLFYLISSCSLIAYVVASSKLCKPIRERLENVPFVGEHISCGICFSITVSLILNLIFPPFHFLIWLTVAFWSGVFWIIQSILLGIKDYVRSKNESIDDRIVSG
jgi:hypothetical protein